MHSLDILDAILLSSLYPSCNKICSILLLLLLLLLFTRGITHINQRPLNEVFICGALKGDLPTSTECGSSLWGPEGDRIVPEKEFRKMVVQHKG